MLEAENMYDTYDPEEYNKTYPRWIFESQISLIVP
jgi:hypothetical protein